MIRRTPHRSDLRWLLAFGVLLVVPWALPDLRSETATDSYQANLRGKKAFYRILQRLDRFDVSRNRRSLQVLLDAVEGSQSETVLLFLGPAREPRRSEWQRLLEFVKAGGGLVYAVRQDAEKFKAPVFGVEARALSHPIDLANDSDAQFTTSLAHLSGSYSWQSELEWIGTAGEDVVTIDGSVQAVRVRRGAGTALFVATDAAFNNYPLTWPDNAVLAIRLMNQVSPRDQQVRVLLDERLNATGVPKIVATLLDPPLRALSWHLLAVLCLFGWWRSRRFGPLLPPTEPRRSDIVAHADALGMLHYRSRNSATVLRLYLEQFRIALALRETESAHQQRVLESISRRRGHPVEVIQETIRQADQASEQKKLDRGKAATTIRRLAKIRRAAGRV